MKLALVALALVALSSLSACATATSNSGPVSGASITAATPGTFGTLDDDGSRK